MEKRKENARYLNQCFTMMVLLNCIIVLFLAFTIVLTQYRVAAAQEAQQFIAGKTGTKNYHGRILIMFFMRDYLL